MSVFSSSRNGEGGRAPGIGSPHKLSILAAGAKLIGHLESDSVVKIEGCLEGSVKAADQVLIASGGLVVGDVIAREAVIGGEIKGDVIASERVELQPGGAVEGDLTTPRFVVHEGGRVNGRVTMAEPGAAGAAVDAWSRSGHAETETEEPADPREAYIRTA